jgi:hypothetical protein
MFGNYVAFKDISEEIPTHEEVTWQVNSGLNYAYLQYYMLKHNDYFMIAFSGLTDITDIRS